METLRSWLSFERDLVVHPLQDDDEWQEVVRPLLHHPAQVVSESDEVDASPTGQAARPSGSEPESPEIVAQPPALDPPVEPAAPPPELAAPPPELAAPPPELAARLLRDGAMLDVIAHLLMRIQVTFGRIRVARGVGDDARVVAERMAADCPHGVAGALLMMQTVWRVCAADAVVAGDAALYIEELAISGTAGAPVAWWPDAIECWVESPEDGARLMEVLAPGGPDASVLLAEWPMCDVLLKHQTVVRVHCQSRPGIPARKECKCRPWPSFEVCRECMRSDADEASGVAAVGDPMLRSELDIPGVRVRRDAGETMWVGRFEGNVKTRPRDIRVRACALWVLRDGRPQPIDESGVERLQGRLAVYARRGWTRVLVPRECVVDGNTVPTPPRILEAIGARFPGWANMLGTEADPDDS